MNLSKTASYSMSILSYMAVKGGSFISAADLHERLGIPYPYLRQVMKALSRQGFIDSIKGRGGGYWFRRSTEEISLADIIDSTDGLDNISKCILGFSKCPFDTACAMHSIWEETRNGMIKILRETTLADLVRKEGSVPVRH